MQDYRLDIQGMRGTAVLLVLMFHVSAPYQLGAGFVGVDIFFVVSGFLIARNIVASLECGRFSLSEFYARRIRRLAPALMVTLLGTLAVGYFALMPEDYAELAKQAIYTVTNTANLYFWRNSDYFGVPAESMFLLHCWSLAVEEQFYLLFPIVLMGVFHLARRRLWVVMAALGLGSFALNVLLVDTMPVAAFYLLPTRGWEFVMGAMAIPAARMIGPGWRAETAGAAGLALVCLSVAGYKPDMPFPGWYALLPTSGTFLLLLAGGGNGCMVSRFLENGLLVYVGRISYALYLVHWPVVVFARQLLGSMDTEDTLLLLGLCFLLAMAIQHLVEDPARYRFKHITHARIVQVYAASGAAVLAICVGLMVSDGMPQRFTGGALRMAKFATDWDGVAAEACTVNGDEGKPMQLCRLGAPGKEPTWLIYGDSHAAAARYVIDAWLKGRGEAGLLGFRPGCVPLLGLGLAGDRGGCRNAMSRVINLAVTDTAAPRNVLLVSKWRQAVGGRLVADDKGHLPQGEAPAVFGAAFHKTLAALNEKGKRVFVWEPVPGGKKPVAAALARAHPQRDPEGLAYSKAQYDAEFQFFFDAVAHSRQMISGVISPSTFLCSTGTCQVREGEIPLYSDQTHISFASHAMWLRIVEDSLPPSAGAPN